MKSLENGQLLNTLNHGNDSTYPSTATARLKQSNTSKNNLNCEFPFLGQMNSHLYQYGHSTPQSYLDSNSNTNTNPNNALYNSEILTNPKSYQPSNGQHFAKQQQQQQQQQQQFSSYPVKMNDPNNKCWWNGIESPYYGPMDVQTKLLQPVQLGGFVNPLTEGSSNLNCVSSSYMQYGHLFMGAPMFSTTMNSSTCVGSSIIATTSSSDLHLVTAPPPTPLDSRSHFSGVSSSGNSTSLYSRSLLSGASNLGSPSNQNGFGPYDQTGGLQNVAQTDDVNYPRCQLQMEGILGKGEFGEIFLARARHIQEGESQSLVLVKSLVSHESGHVKEFHRQLDLFGQADHNFVTRLLGVCMEQEPYYMLLEYCEWGDLKQFLRCMSEENSAPFKMPPLTLTQKSNLTKQLALGMNYLSHMQLVHRDLAARNVLLTQELNIKISNLGLARDVYANEYYQVPNSDHFVPVRWLAPELLNGVAVSMSKSTPESKQPDNVPLSYSIQTDIWAFGILVWEIFTLAAVPYSRMSDYEVLLAGQHAFVVAGGPNKVGESAKLATFRPDVPNEMPAELAELLDQCWTPNPLSRPTFNDIAIVLSKLASS